MRVERVLALFGRDGYNRGMSTAAYAALSHDLERAFRHAKDGGGDELGQAVAWLIERFPERSSSELMHLVAMHRNLRP